MRSEFHQQSPGLILEAGEVGLKSKVGSHSKAVCLILKEPKITPSFFFAHPVPSWRGSAKPYLSQSVKSIGFGMNKSMFWSESTTTKFRDLKQILWAPVCLSIKRKFLLFSLIEESFPPRPVVGIKVDDDLSCLAYIFQVLVSASSEKSSMTSPPSPSTRLDPFPSSGLQSHLWVLLPRMWLSCCHCLFIGMNIPLDYNPLEGRDVSLSTIPSADSRVHFWKKYFPRTLSLFSARPSSMILSGGKDVNEVGLIFPETLFTLQLSF